MPSVACLVVVVVECLLMYAVVACLVVVVVECLLMYAVCSMSCCCCCGIC